MSDSERSPESQAAQPEVATVPGVDRDTLLIEYLQHFCAQFTSDRREQSMRVLKSGLFIDESLVPDLSARFLPWYQQKAGHSISEHKATKRLLGDGPADLMYLIERKSCIAGHLIRCAQLDPHQLGVPYFMGSLTSAIDFLHPRDPALATLKGVRAIVDPQGVRIEFELRDKSIAISPENLPHFTRAVRSFAKYGLHVESPPRTGRELVAALAELLRRMRPVTDHQTLLVPLSPERNGNLLRWKSTIAVIDANNRLTLLYETRGRGFEEFIHAQIALLGEAYRASSAKRIQNFRFFTATQSGIIGELSIGPDVFSVSTRSLIEFIAGIPREVEGSISFSAPYTVADALTRFVDVIKQSSFVDVPSVPPKVRASAGQTGGFRQYKEWYLTFTRRRDRFTIEGCKNSLLLALSKAPPSRGERTRIDRAPGPQAPRGQRQKSQSQRPHRDQNNQRQRARR